LLTVLLICPEWKAYGEKIEKTHQKIKVALAHPAASNGVCPRQRSGCNGY